MGRFVIVAYKPKKGQDAALEAAVGKHLKILRDEGLVSNREGYIMRASSGTVVEVFEWASAEAIKAAHTNPSVLKLWAEFASVCEYVPLASLEEAEKMFAEFEPVSL